MAFEFAPDQRRGLAAAGIAGCLGAEEDEIFVGAGAEGEAGRECEGWR